MTGRRKGAVRCEGGVEVDEIVSDRPGAPLLVHVQRVADLKPPPHFLLLYGGCSYKQRTILEMLLN